MTSGTFGRPAGRADGEARLAAGQADIESSLAEVVEVFIGGAILYKGEGCLVFTGGGAFAAGGDLIQIAVDPAGSCYVP